MLLENTMKSKIIIGHKDFADFPEFNIENIKIKMDTGAYTSSIHCHDIEECLVDGNKMIKFDLLDPGHELYNNESFKTHRYKEKKIKNSFGATEKRFIIFSTIILFGKQYPIELSLSERGDMKFPVLIGRKLLKGKFIVDSAKYDLSYKAKLKEQKIILTPLTEK
jgi:hypothetical protein